MSSTTSSTTAASSAVIDAVGLRSRLDGADAPRVLDVRTPAEFETSHVPGSYSVPLVTLKEHAGELRRHLDEDIVLVCRSGTRARQAAEVLFGVGLPGLRVLEGGMNAWEDSGAPVNRGRQTWELERQVRFVAGSLVATGVVASTAVPQLMWLSGAVGGALVFAAVSNTCAMGNMLSRMPWNQGTEQADLDELVSALRSGS